MLNLRGWSRKDQFAVGYPAPAVPQAPANNSNRRRIVIFLAVFLAGCVASAIYGIVSPPEYRASARLEIVPASSRSLQQEESAGPRSPSAENGLTSFLTQVQVLTSRPLLEQVVARLGISGEAANGQRTDPVQDVQRMLSSEAVEGTRVVRVQARGSNRELLPRLVNTLTDVYRQHLAAAYREFTESGKSQLHDEIRLLDQQVAGKRQELETFRARYDIVSAERDENQALSTVKGLGEALSDANSEVAAAEGQLRAVRNSIAAGEALTGAKDDPTLAAIEERASKLREQLHDLELRFTPQYLNLDPAVKELRARLEDLDQQTRSQHAAGQRAGLAQAQQQLASARATAERLQQQLNDSKRGAQEFSARLNEYKAMQEDLAHLEQLHRAAIEQLAKREAREAEDAPQVQILEAATVPQEPVYPPYLPAVIGAAASLILGLIAVRLVEFLARPGAAAQSRSLQPYWPVLDREAQVRAPPLLTAAPTQLPAPTPLPRQLTDAEIVTLLEAANDDGRLVVTALLTGLTVAELVGLRWEDVDLDAGTINLPGNSARVVTMSEPLRNLIRLRRAAQQPTPSPTSTADETADLVACTAYDAGLADAHEVTPAVLRHTYVAYLLRQGIRFADISRIAGRLSQDELATHMRLASPQARVPLEQIDPILPALRGTADRQS